MATRARIHFRKRPEFLGVLALRDYRWFLASAAFADLGIALRFVVTGWVVLELTDSAAWVGLVIGITALPSILLALFEGVVADRVSKRRILITVRMSHAGLAFLAGLLISTGAIEAWHLLAISIGIGLAMAFGRPTGGSWVPTLVPRERLVSTNGMLGAANNSGEIIGPGLGGWLIGTSGTDTVLFIVAGVYAASFLTLGFVRDPGASTRVVRKAVLIEIKEGLKFAAGSQVILGILIINSTGIFATALITMMPVYAPRRARRWRERAWGDGGCARSRIPGRFDHHHADWRRAAQSPHTLGGRSDVGLLHGRIRVFGLFSSEPAAPLHHRRRWLDLFRHSPSPFFRATPRTKCAGG